MTETDIFDRGGVPAGRIPSAVQESALEQGHGKTTGKTVVAGHTPHEVVTKYENNIFAVDTGAFATGILSAYDVINDVVYEATAKEISLSGCFIDMPD